MLRGESRRDDLQDSIQAGVLEPLEQVLHVSEELLKESQLHHLHRVHLTNCNAGVCASLCRGGCSMSGSSTSLGILALREGSTASCTSSGGRRCISS